MAPRKVNKEEKRREIALACFDLIHEVGMKKITVSNVAKTAGIGKGTVYEYFESKDDIIFEIINMHIDHHHNKFLEMIKDVKTTRQKVFHFLDFVMNDSEENTRHFSGYKDYLSVVLGDEKEEMKKFNTKCYLFFENKLHNIIKEGIESKELKENALDFVDGIMAFEKGVALQKMTQENFDSYTICKNFIDNLFDMLEVQK